MAWAILIALLLGWEFLTLVMDPRNFPTLSSVTEYFWRFRSVQVVAYAMWVWLGWDIVLDRADGPAPWLRRPMRTAVGRAAVAAAVVAFGWWATALPHTAARWAALGVPAGFLIAAAWGVRRRTERPSVWWTRTCAWIRDRRP